MLDLSKSIFPYYESSSSSISLYRIFLTDELDQFRYSINLDEKKAVDSLTKFNTKSLEPAAEKFHYIDNSSEVLAIETLAFNLQCPLLIEFPDNFNKLKLSIGQIRPSITAKSLIIVKSNTENIETIQTHLQSQNTTKPGIEISKLNYHDLPFNSNEKVTINDCFNVENINGKVTVSLWDFNDDTNEYLFLLKFCIWINSPPLSHYNFQDSPPSDSVTSISTHPSKQEIDPTLNSLHAQIPPLNKTHITSKAAGKVSPINTNIDLTRGYTVKPKESSSNSSELSPALKVGNFKKEFNFDIEDGPNFRKAIKAYDSNLHHYKKACLKLYDELKNLETSIGRLTLAKTRCIEQITHIIDYQFNPILRELNFNSELESKVNALFDPIERNLKFFISDICNLNQVKKICQNLTTSTKDSRNKSEIHDILEHSKKVFENNSKEYYAWLNKYLSNEKGRPESKLLRKRKDFELSKFDYLNQLNSITNNQYINRFLEGLFKFINLGFDKKLYLQFASFRDVKQSESLLPYKYYIYLLVLSRFNSEKGKFRQLIEASSTNEELTKVIRYSSLNHNTTEHLELDNTIVEEDNLELIFENSFDLESPTNISNDADMSGILYALGGKGKPGWHKEWVVLKNGQLMEFADWRKGRTPINTPIEIALCNVKQVSHEKRQNCIEVNTSTGNKHVFQAINADEVNKWIRALYQSGQVVNKTRLQQNLISPQPVAGSIGKNRHKLKSDTNDNQFIAGTSCDRTISPVSILSKTLNEVDYLGLVLAIPDSDNGTCVDCGSREVGWVSINLLVLICVDCASCHRNLGTHISKIRSLRLDTFDEELRYLFQYVNNRKANLILESDLHSPKPTPNTSHEERLEFIKMKYATKSFTKQVEDVGNFLIKAIQKIDIPKVLEAIICGADIDMNIQIKAPNSEETQIISLFEYSLRKYIEIEASVPPKRVFIISELLLLNGCEIDNLKISNRDIGLTDDALQYWQLRTGKTVS